MLELQGHRDVEYKIIRSNRKSFGLELNAKGLVVRAPLCATDRQIDEFICHHKNWIEKHLNRLEQQQKRSAELPKLTEDEIQELANKAAEYIPERVRHYAPIVGVTYGRITIRKQRTRWGSCSSKGNLNFNCLLMLAPPEVIDSVVVHELCHRKQMNHSPRFYDEVLRVFPDYNKWNKWLKENGASIMCRLAL